MQETAPIRQNLLRSLAFWFALLFSATLFAVVSLSPKVLEKLTLEHQNRENQMRLLAVEKQVEHLKRINDALKNDANFARELARNDFEAARPDEHRIPVEDNLTLAARPGAPDLTVAPPELPWYTSLLRLASDYHNFGNALLTVAGAVIIFAFAFLQDRTSQEVRD